MSPLLEKKEITKSREADERRILSRLSSDADPYNAECNIFDSDSFQSRLSLSLGGPTLNYNQRKNLETTCDQLTFIALGSSCFMVLNSIFQSMKILHEDVVCKKKPTKSIHSLFGYFSCWSSLLVLFK